MHNNFTDKNRRYISLRQPEIKNVLPEHFQADYPKFITLLEKYYEFQNENDSTELLNHLFASRDINETDITLLSYIEDELLLGDAYFEGFGETDAELRATANFSSVLFRAKGTRFAIEWFFRSFYGLDAEVQYPKEQVFQLNDGDSRIGAESLHFLTDDKLYQTFAILIRVGIPVSKWNDVFKLFTHPAGMYLGGEVLLTDEAIMQLLSDESFVNTYTTASYGFVVTPSDSGDEGTTFTVTGTRTGGDPLDSGNSTLFWHIEHVSTGDSDFVGTPPDSNTPDYFDFTNNSGAFQINTRIDSDELEGVENFNVVIRDQEDNLIQTLNLLLNPVVATYVLTASATEGGGGAGATDTLGSVIDSDNPYHFWQFDSAAGTTSVLDRAGNFNLTLSSPGKDSATSSRADGFGSAADFDHNINSGNIYQSSGAESCMSLTQDFTISWAMRNASQYSGFRTHYIFEKYQDGEPNSEFHFYIQDLDSVSGTEFHYGFRQSDGTARFGEIVPDLEAVGWADDNQWRWYSLKMDYSGTGFLRLKMNNVEIGSVNVSGWSGSWRNNTNGQFGSTFEHVDGGLDEIAFFQTALDSDAEQRQYEAWSAAASVPTLNIPEGDLIYYDIVGTNVPDGNILMNYWVDSTSVVTDSDIQGTMPIIGSPLSVQVINDSARFTLRTRIDNIVDDNESLILKIQTQDGQIRDSATVNITDVTPTFIASVPNVIEGNPVLATLTCDSTAIGETVTWVMTDSAGADARVLTTSSSLVLTGINDTYNLSTTNANDLSDSANGLITFTNSNYTPVQVATDTFVLVDDSAEYTITASPAAGSEGDSVTFDIGGTNIPNGNVYWQIIHLTTDDDDFTVVPPDSASRGLIVMNNNLDSASPSVTFASN